MGLPLVGAISGAGIDADAYGHAVRSAIIPRGRGYSVQGVTGTISAAQSANGGYFAMYLDPSATDIAWIERIVVQYTTIVAYTTPVTAGRRLEWYRGSGTMAQNGANIATAAKKDSGAAASKFNTANGDIRISTTSTLGFNSITFESTAIDGMALTHVGAAGNNAEKIFEFPANKNHPLIVRPGELIALRNTQAMDAAGTWQLSVCVHWHEAAAF